MENLIAIDDFRKMAKQKVTAKGLECFYFSFGGEGQTNKDNHDAFRRYRLRPRVLKDVSSVDLSTTILGKKISFPVCAAPIGLNKLLHEDGDAAIARATSDMGTGFALSTLTTTDMSDIASEVPNALKWIQIQFFKNRAFLSKLLNRATENNYDGIVLTIDQPVSGTRYALFRNNFTLPSYLSLPHFPDHKSEQRDRDFFEDMFDPSAQWTDIAWLKKITKLPIYLKGILDGETARKAMEYEVDGIIVSNHGGRQLDGVPATIDVLKEVIEAVDGKCDVFLDGGVRNGTDVLKAVALGAKAVFIGSPVVWGLACYGEEGVKKTFSLLRNEFKNAMQLMGFTTIEELQAAKNIVVHETYFR